MPIVTPSTSTDKSVVWKSQNNNIASVNWDGVVIGWNLGETIITASTSNDLRAKCMINVVKDNCFIDTTNIILDQTDVTLIVNGDSNQFATISAEVEPLFATNTNVVWSKSYEINECISLITLDNNRVKIVLNDSGNIGIGYVTATTQSGKSASCLVKVIYQSDNERNCLDESHLQQEG